MAGPLLGFLLGNVGKVAGANAEINRQNEQRQTLLDQLLSSGLPPKIAQQQALLLQSGQGLSPQLFAQGNQMQQPGEQVETITSEARAAQLGIAPHLFKKFTDAGILLQRHPDGQIKEAANIPTPLVQNTINQGSAPQPLGEKANNFMMPDGSRASPAMTLQEVLGLGGQLVTPERESALKTEANIKARIKVFDEEVVRTRGILNKAQARWEKSKTAENKRLLDNAATQHKLALAQRANFTGEPSEGVSRQFQSPGAIGGTVEETVDTILGGQRDSGVIDFNELPNGR